MNETLILVLALATGVLLGAIFFGGLWWTVQKGFRPNGRPFGSSAACCYERALPWLVSILSRVVIGRGCWCASLDLSWRAFS